MMNFLNTSIYLTLAIFQKTQSLFDDSKYKIVVGKMKDEHKGISITNFVELKSKMHSIL